jgi:hypothetical protein
MALLPEPIHQTKGMIYRWYEEKNEAESMRPYLGASIIGNPCRRYLWLSFRWALKSKFEGRLLRLFNTGHREESRMVEELRGIGCEVWETDPLTNKQFEITDCNGHFRGHLDGKALGIPEAHATVHVLEFKTHNTKSFNELKAKKVQEAKPMHWAQMQVYMFKENLDRAMYIAVCKDTDELYIERIELDGHAAQALIDKARTIIEMNEPPPRLSEDPSWFACKWCDMHPICHGTTAPLPNCRTCAHSTPAEDDEWVCTKYNCQIPLDNQAHGCDSHRYIPILLDKFAVMEDVVDDTVVYKNTLTGNSFSNGNDFLSREIYLCADKKALGDPGLKDFRKKLGDNEVIG